MLSFARDCFFVGRNGVRAGPARAICPTGANSQSQQFAGRPAAAASSGLAGGPAGIARRIRIQRIRNGRVLARHQRGRQSAAQCAAPFPSAPARSALNQIRRFRAQAPPSKGRQKNESRELYDCDWQDCRHPRRDRCHRRGCVGICECWLGANRVCALRQLLPHRTIDANHDAFDGGALLSVTKRNQRIEVIGCNRPSTRYHWGFIEARR